GGGSGGSVGASGSCFLATSRRRWTSRRGPRFASPWWGVRSSSSPSTTRWTTARSGGLSPPCSAVTDEPSGCWRHTTGVTGRRAVGDASATLPLSRARSEEHTSELQSRGHLVCRLLLEK